MRNKISAAEKDRIMTRMMSTAAGRSKLAATMIQPLRTLRDYESVLRRAFLIDELPDGVPPMYDKDVDVPAYVVAEQGDSIQRVVTGERILIPLYELTSYPKIPFTQVKERRFDIVARVKNKMRFEMFRAEDKKLAALMTAAGNDSKENPKIVVSEANFKVDDIIDAMALVEQHGLRVDKLFMNPYQFKVLRKAGRDFLDFTTQADLLKTGFMANAWGAKIYTCMEIPKGNIYCVTEPEYFGVMPIRIDLTVLPADDPASRTFGWSAFCQQGTGLNGTIGLSMVQVTA